VNSHGQPELLIVWESIPPSRNLKKRCILTYRRLQSPKEI